MIRGATFLPNPANTLESWVTKLQRALVANSQTRPRYSDIEEVQIARMGSVHAGCPLFPFTSTRATRRENARHGQGSRDYDTTHDTTFPAAPRRLPRGKLSERTIRRMFKNEPGVLCRGSSERRFKKDVAHSRDSHATAASPVMHCELRSHRLGNASVHLRSIRLRHRGLPALCPMRLSIPVPSRAKHGARQRLENRSVCGK
jgi:hypothetical protein